MASIVQRRQSLSGTPRITIPSNKQDELDTFNVTSPPSGSISPDLQPNTPPVLPVDSQKNQVLQIGRYLLVELIDTYVYKAVNIQTGREKICKVCLDPLCCMIGH